MPGEGGFTFREDSRYVRESLVIESGLAMALDDISGDVFEPMLEVSAERVCARADEVASIEGPAAARDLLVREASRLARWERAMNLGLAGNDAEDPLGQVEEVRVHLSKVVLSAVIYGFHAGVPAERLMNEIVAVGALELSDSWRYSVVRALAACYRTVGHPDLALSLLVRSRTSDPAQDVRILVDTARETYAIGRVGRLAAILEFVGWASDPTGLAKDLIRRLVSEREPSPAQLTARVRLRRQALEAGDWARLRELATSDVMWLEEDATLWRALSAILVMSGAPDQAALADRVADLVAGAGDSP